MIEQNAAMKTFLSIDHFLNSLEHAIRKIGKKVVAEIEETKKNPTEKNPSEKLLPKKRLHG